MKILFIGNSYTYFNDLASVFEKLAVENGKDVKAYSVTRGDRKLSDNVLSDDETTKKLDALLSEHHFDVVFLQEYSTLPLTDRNAFETGVSMMCEKLKDSADKIILYETWSRKEGCFVLSDNGWTVESMTFGLEKAYCEAARKFGTGVSYVGSNFYKAKDGAELYNADQTHPSYSGSCLAALTHYRTVFGAFPEKTSSLQLDEKELALFRDVVNADQKYVGSDEAAV